MPIFIVGRSCRSGCEIGEDGVEHTLVGQGWRGDVGQVAHEFEFEQASP
jgi:hypothetical protein